MEKATAPSIFRLDEADQSRILHGFAVREEIIGLLTNAPRGDAVGAAVSFLLLAAEHDPGAMRTVMESVAIAPDGRRARIIDLITQVVR